MVMLKNKKVEIRVSEEEKEHLKRICAAYPGLTMSEYGRRKMFSNNPITDPNTVRITKELINEINHIGVNINQIVKNHNSEFYSLTEKHKLQLLLGAIEDKLDEVLSVMR